MKRKTTLSLLAALILGAPSLIAQGVEDYDRIYYSNPEPIEVEDGSFKYELKSKNAFAQADHNKFGLTIQNNSNDFIYYDSKETTFKYSFGDKHPTVKPLYINPNDSKTKTLLVNGGDQFRQKEFAVEVGGLYRIPVEGTVEEAPEFQLPASSNNFTSGNFKVILKKYDASTREAKAQFEVTYLGDDLAIVDASNLSVRAKRKKSEEEVVYANDDTKSKANILNKGDKLKFNAVFHIDGRIVDMQFATMHIIWNGTFVETKAIPIKAETINFAMDEALTREKK